MHEWCKNEVWTWMTEITSDKAQGSIEEWRV